MTTPHTIECTLPLRRRGRAGQQPSPAAPAPPPSSPADRIISSSGRVPRVARLMALALRYEQLLRAGRSATTWRWPRSSRSPGDGLRRS